MGTGVDARESANRRPNEQRLGSARQRVAREREILQADVAAFKAFHRRVNAIETDDDVGVEVGPLDEAAPADLPASSGSGEGASTAGDGLEAVREAYEETVMAVSHYEAEYGDTYRESVESEFGDGLASALCENPGFSAFLKDQLLAAVREATQNRLRLLQALEREADALEDAATTLRAVREELAAIDSRPFFECSREELEDLRGDLDDLEARCDDLAARRQAGDLHSASTLLSSQSAPTLGAYLYGELGCQYPVLRGLAELTDDIETTRRHVETAHASRIQA